MTESPGGPPAGPVTMGDPEANSLYNSEQVTSFILGPNFLILKMRLHSNNGYGLFQLRNAVFVGKYDISKTSVNLQWTSGSPQNPLRCFYAGVRKPTGLEWLAD